MSEYTFVGLLLFALVAITVLLYLIEDFIERRFKENREYKQLKERRKAQRRVKRSRAVVQQARMDEVTKEIKAKEIMNV